MVPNLITNRASQSTGPGWVSNKFFQKNWEVLKSDVVKAVKIFFDSGTMPPRVNETTIVLLPKKNELEVLKDFRPISLCNVI
jgi:hypothetical protein